MSGSEIDEGVLEEGCYYLSELGMPTEEIASHFELEPSRVRGFVSSYASRVKSGEVAVDAFDRAFWEGVVKEAEGDVKLTFISEKGFHHAWKSELKKLDGRALMSIFEASKDFLNSDPNQRFLDYAAPKGYDPLALEREVRKALEVVGKLLEEKFKEGDSRPDGRHRRTQS
jgi:hypothetical protein